MGGGLWNYSLQPGTYGKKSEVTLQSTEKSRQRVGECRVSPKGTAEMYLCVHSFFKCILMDYSSSLWPHTAGVIQRV